MNENTLQAELLLSQSEALRLSEMNQNLAEQLADARAEVRKQEQALRDSMDTEGHYRLYVRYRNQRDDAEDRLAKALNEIEAKDDARVLAEERLAYARERAWEEALQYIATQHAYNGAPDPGQEFYDRGLNGWLLSLPNPFKRGEGADDPGRVS